mgnify:CR=1 FL=1
MHTKDTIVGLLVTYDEKIGVITKTDHAHTKQDIKLLVKFTDGSKQWIMLSESWPSNKGAQVEYTTRLVLFDRLGLNGKNMYEREVDCWSQDRETLNNREY